MLVSQEMWAVLVGKSHKVKVELVLPGEEAYSVQMSGYKSKYDTGRKRETGFVGDRAKPGR